MSPDLVSFKGGTSNTCTISILKNGNRSLTDHWRVLVPWMWVGVGDFSKVLATFNHVVGSVNLFMATTGDIWIIPSLRILDYILHVTHITCVITNFDQHQWAIHSPFSIALYALLEENTARKLLSLYLDLVFQTLPFNVTFIILFCIAIVYHCFLRFGLVL